MSRRHPSLLALPGCPFRHHAKTTDKPRRLHPAPERCTVAASVGPCRRKLLGEGIERSHPTAEDVGAPAAHHLTHNPTGFSGSPHDVLDRDPLASERQDGGVFFLATEPAGMLAAFGATQQRRINDSGTHGS